MKDEEDRQKEGGIIIRNKKMRGRWEGRKRKKCKIEER